MVLNTRVFSLKREREEFLSEQFPTDGSHG